MLHISPVLVPQYPPTNFTVTNSGSPSSAAADSYHTPTKSNPSYSHRMFETRVPSQCNASPQRSRISYIAMYYAFVLCLLRTYASISSETT